LVTDHLIVKVAADICGELSHDLEKDAMSINFDDAHEK
jgi:hypothetical protein